MRMISSFLRRLSGLFAGLWLLGSMPSCGGTDQLHGMFFLPFPSTAVCNAQQQLVTFRNTAGTELFIDGAAIAVGTDTEGNFVLNGIRIGSQTTQATAGILNDIQVPAGATYSFDVSYTPRTENTAHTAVLDIAYGAPKEGIIQVTLSGTSTIKSPGCPSSSVDSGDGAGDLDGDMTITVNKIAFVSSALQQPISTNPDNTFTPFVTVDVPITFDADEDAVILRAITEDLQFLLPRTKTAPLSNLITEFTLVTSAGESSGLYGDDGSVTVKDVPIHLKEQFEADFVVTLTTGQVAIPSNLPKRLLTAAGFSMTDDQKFILGSSIKEKTFQVTLVGISTFTNAGGTGTVAQSIGGTSGAVIIEATVNPPDTKR